MTPETKKESAKDPLTVFLDSVTNKNTKSNYARGIEMFLRFTGKTVEQILAERQSDLAIIPNEEPVPRAQRANRFEREYLEPFYQAMITSGSTLVPENVEPYRPNTAAKYTDGILRLLHYYSMGFSLRNGSPISEGHRGIGETRFPMKIEHVRLMFWKERDLMYKVALSLAVDFPARMSDFISIKVSELPDLEQQPPIEFQRVSTKEHQLQKSCLSEQTVNLLKEYLKVYKPKKWLFENKEGNHVSDIALNRELLFLAKECNINTENMKITWHCFRDMVYSAAKTQGIDPDVIDLMLGKAISKARLPYMKSLDITKPFMKLKETLAINGQLLVARHDDILSKMALTIKELQLSIENKDKEIVMLRRELGVPEDIMTAKYSRKTIAQRIENIENDIGYLVRQQELMKQQQAKDKET